jgi:hypothetical protein
MTDVSLSVAMITAAAGVAGGSIPSITNAIRDGRQAKRDQRNRQTEAERQVCLDLLAAASELRARVANAAACHGDELDARLAQIRDLEATIHVHAASIAFLAPENLAKPADRVADAASRLVKSAEGKVAKTAKEMVERPDFQELDDSVKDFQDSAVKSTRARAASGRFRSARARPGRPHADDVVARDQ